MSVEGERCEGMERRKGCVKNEKVEKGMEELRRKTESDSSRYKKYK